MNTDKGKANKIFVPVYPPAANTLIGSIRVYPCLSVDIFLVASLQLTSTPDP